MQMPRLHGSRGGTMGRKAALRLAAIPFVMVACGPPIIYDTSHRQVRDPLITAAVDNGWLAVDSTGNAVRVVVELQMEGPSDASDYVGLHLLRFHCSVSGEHIPAKVLREAPSCPVPGAPPMRCPDGTSIEECEAIRVDAEQNCLYTIRAEFLFDEMPHLDENEHFFTFGQTDQPIRWTRSSGG